MVDEQKQLLQDIETLFETERAETLGTLLNDRRSSDIAEIVELLDDEENRAVFNVLEKPLAAEVLEKVEEATRARLFNLLREDEIETLVAELDYDDAADLLAELPEEISQKVLRHIAPAESAEIKELMMYSEDSAGGIMDPVLISVPDDATVAQAISKIRAAEIDEDFYSVFVVDKHEKFVGDVRIRYLITSPEDTLIVDLIDPDALYVTVDTDQEEVRNVFSKNDLIVMPVLDEDGRLVGRITADRIIEVAEDEAAEDLYAMAGTDPDELDKFSALHAARIRMTWLLPCLIGTSITAFVMMLFRAHYSPVFVAAAAFVPMIGAMSGNAGLQTSAIVVSGLATGHLAALRLGQVFSREVRIAMLVALSCAVVGGLLCAFLPQLLVGAGQTPNTDFVRHSRIVFAFGVGMFSAIMVATTLGLLLPFLFRSIGIDPAISSGPLVTTANDSISCTIYMTFALLLSQ